METKTYRVGNMDCANCAKEVERGVGRLSGVEWVEVNFTTGKMLISGEYNVDQLAQRVEDLGKTLIAESEPSSIEQGDHSFWQYLANRHDTRLSLMGLCMVLPVFLLNLIFNFPEQLTAVIYIVAMLLALLPIARSGLQNLRINRRANINLLMSVAGIGAVAIGEYLEAYVVIALFALGEALEGFAAARARRSVNSLLTLQPDNAIRVDGETERLVPVSAIAVGDHVLIRPGDRVPVDGVVISGSSAVDEATITGESVPVEKAMDTPVYAGTLNGNGLLRIEVLNDAENSTVQRIIRLVEETQSRRAPIQRTIDQFAEIYTPMVMVIALMVAVIPPVVFGAPFWDQPGQHGWFYRALAMLVIACPCSLVISTPVTIISSITAAARRGVLVKGGEFLEILGRVRVLAFDKTGTLTIGKPVVQTVQSVSCSGNDRCEACEDLLAIAEAAERQSTHPLAHAVLEKAQAWGAANRYQVQDVIQIPGGGIQAQVNGKIVTVGSSQFIGKRYGGVDGYGETVAEIESRGQSAMLIHDGEQVMGVIGVSDQPRPEAQSVIDQVHGFGLQTMMLTGDNPRTAEAIRDTVHVQQYRDSLLPEGKVAEITRLTREHGVVAMVGDGVNDTPALAAASVGVAMGGIGSAQALETADVVLMADDLKQLPYLIRLSRLARRLIRQNIGLTFVVKVLFLLFAAFGLTTLWLAILADVGMALMVTLNGMRPLHVGFGE